MLTRDVYPTDLYVFLDKEVARQNVELITSLQAIANSQLEDTERYEDYIKWSWLISETNRLYTVWSLLERCLSETGPDTFPYIDFRELKDSLGDENYFRGWMPSPVPEAWPKGGLVVPRQLEVL